MRAAAIRSARRTLKGWFMIAHIVKCVVAAASVGVFAGLAGPAQAVSIGVLTPTVGASFYSIGNPNITSTGFDAFDFTLSADALLTLTNGVELSSGGNNLTFTSVVLRNVDLSSIVAPLVGGIVNQPAGGIGSPEDTFTFAWGLLDSSYAYQLTVGRSLTGTRAAWAGTIGVTAVPLPAALPLFASGLVGLGFLGRRRMQRDGAKAKAA